MSLLLLTSEKEEQFFQTPLLLSKSREGEQLLIYLAVLEVDVSVVLLWEDEGTQFHVSYVNKILPGAKA